MKIAITGATGFLGRHILSQLAAEQHQCRCWYRPESDRTGLEHVERYVEWVEGALGQREACSQLVDGCQALVHAALERPARANMSGREFTPEMAMHNVAGSLQLFEAARAAGVERIVYISSCAVYGQILEDRPLDENHPLLPNSHYGAHKAAVEAFVHSHALGDDYTICALRPTGIYGLAHPAENSKWYDLVTEVVGDQSVTCHGGGKEVHASDVARATSLLLHADSGQVAGQSFNCYDIYVSQYEVAKRAKAFAGSHAEILGEPAQPKHQIDTQKLRSLGFQFGGQPLFERTIREMIGVIRTSHGSVV